MAIPLILAGLAVLTAGAEVLVRGASGLARAVGLPPLIIGLTVVAYGTSAPELAVSIGASAAGRVDLAIGNVLGSNTFNVLFILGLSALIAPLVVSAQLVRMDVPILIGASVLAWLFAADGVVGRGEGLALCAGLFAYTALLVRLGKRQPAEPPATEVPAAVPAGGGRLALSALFVLVGLGLLVLGARWLVDGATDVARALGVGELTIGLTIVAAGTSMPELATSVVASVRGQRDIAVGNVVGSNTFNLLGVLGASAAIAPEGVAVPASALRFDVPVVLAVALACLPIFFTGGRISRWEGALFLGGYAAYATFLVMAAKQHAALETFGSAMLWFVLPLTALGLIVSVVDWVSRRPAGTP